MINKVDGIRLREFCQFKKEIRVSTEYPVIGPIVPRRSTTTSSARKAAPHALAWENATKKKESTDESYDILALGLKNEDTAHPGERASGKTRAT